MFGHCVMNSAQCGFYGYDMVFRKEHFCTGKEHKKFCHLKYMLICFNAKFQEVLFLTWCTVLHWESVSPPALFRMKLYSV